MTSVAPSDNQKVNEIVNKLKKQGLFDQFRKDCLADVDTKPAYLNLRHRVENAVNSFLSVYKWRPDLNRNSIRESVRKHINESQMLSSGVDHIIEQVVNPKVHNTFKPAIDKVVYECLGIDPQEWEAKIHMKEELKRRGQNIRTEGGLGIPSLLDMSVGSSSAPTPVSNIGAVNNLPSYQQSSPVYQSPYANFPQPGFQPRIPGFQFPGMLPYTNPMQLPGMPGYDINTALGLPSAANLDLGKQQVDISAEANADQEKDSPTKDKKKKDKKKLEPLTVEDLLNIPLPKDETKPEKGSKRENKNDVDYDYNQVEETVVMDSTYDGTMENVVTEGEYSQDEQVITDDYQTEVIETDDQTSQEGQSKVYHFAWQDLYLEQEVTLSSDTEVMDF